MAGQSLTRSFYLTYEQTEELDRRLATYKANPSAAIPWREAQDEKSAKTLLLNERSAF